MSRIEDGTTPKAERAVASTSLAPSAAERVMAAMENESGEAVDDAKFFRLLKEGQLCRVVIYKGEKVRITFTLNCFKGHIV